MRDQIYKNFTHHHLVNIKWVLAISFGLFWMAQAKLVFAQNEYSRYQSFDKTAHTEILYVLSKGGSIDSGPESLKLRKALQNASRAVTETLKFPLFQNLAESFVLINPEWTKSGGYFSSDLKIANRPGVLIGLSNLATETQAKRVIAHELAHLLFAESNSNEVSWVKEGVALLVESLVTGQMSQDVREAFLHPEVTLIGNFNPKLDSYHTDWHQAAQYGNVQLYFSYLYQNCGKDQFFAHLFEKNHSPLPLLDSLLKNSPCPVGKSFIESFKNYSIAKALQDFSDPLKHVLFDAVEIVAAEHPAKLEPFSETVYRLKEGAHCQANEIQASAQNCIRIRTY